ncbi:MAG: hypothetical protein HY952_05325 [Elusimicrobia bacterium]|jgi:hypothetical protein|nr:hypothetical protein [Elusimicrobiota bacterium]
MLKKAWRLVLAVFGAVDGLPHPVGVEKILYDPGGKVRAAIYKMSDGNFCWQEETYNDKLLDMRWEPRGMSQSQPTPQAAEAAARKALAWLWAVQE